MEITILDSVLFAWAVIATVKWIESCAEIGRVRVALVELLGNEKLRDRVVADFKEWKAERK